MSQFAVYHSAGSMPVEYEVDSIDGDLCSLKNPDGKVFVTSLPVIADPEKEEVLPQSYAVLKKAAPKKSAQKGGAAPKKATPPESGGSSE